MSLWNRIGDIASTAGKFTGELTGELLGAGRGVAQFAWDVGTASFNDAEKGMAFSPSAYGRNDVFSSLAL